VTLLTLVRHGQTDWNLEGRIQGTTDIPLNDTGRRQAHEAATSLGARLDRTAPLVVVSSDLSRARETAEIIAADLGADAPRLYPQLRERGYGEGEGMPVAELRERFGEWHDADIPGAEPWPAVRRRAIRGLRRVVADVRAETAPAGAAVVVVSHGAFIRELIRHATGGALPLPGQRLENGSSYTVLLERERLRLAAPLH
jgi:broad specificity phosphatase PhoE